MAKKLPAGEGNILEQGQKYEGYVVWFNNLVASAGGTIVNAEGRPTLDDAARQGRADHQGRRHLRPRRPVAVDRAGGPGAARVRGRQGRLPAQLAVRLRRRAHRRRDATRSRRRSSRTWATPAGPGVNKGEPSKVSIGGANLGIPKTGQNPELATEAALCMTSAKWQAQEAINEGLPPVMNSTYDDAEGPQGLPVRRPAARAAQGLGRAPADPVLLRRDAGDPGLAAPAGRHQPAEVDQHARVTACNILADGGMY